MPYSEVALLLEGREGGQSAVGASDSGNGLTIDSTSHATKGRIWLKGIQRRSLATITGNTTLDNSHSIVLCNNSSDITVTLPAAASATDGALYTIKKIGNNTNTVTIDGNSSETIDGATTVVLYIQHDFLRIVSDGSNWHIVEDGRRFHQARIETTTDTHNTTAQEKVLLDTSVVDIGGMVDIANNRIVVRRAGRYNVTGAVLMLSGGAGTYGVRLFKDGSLYDPRMEFPLGAGSPGLCVSAKMDMAASGVIELYGFKNAAGSITMRGWLDVTEIW